MQAISRVNLCYAMRILPHCMVCAYVHDELLIKCWEDVSLDVVREQMEKILPKAYELVLRTDWE